MNLGMRGPAAGVFYSLWLRLRWVLGGMMIYIAALALAVQLAPAAMMVSYCGVLALASVGAHVITVFTLGPSDVAARGSGFPKSMMVLPMQTRALAGWPMLYGAAGVAIIWILVAALVLRPAGLHIPIFWPAAMAAAGMAWLQAMGWSPFPSPFARVPALALAMTPLILLGALAGLDFESRDVAAIIIVASLVWMLVAYAVAVRGLSRARSGSDGDWVRVIVDRLLSRLRTRHSAVGRRLPFRSAAMAQLWHECRCNAIALPVMLSFVGMPMLFLIMPTVMNDDRGKDLMIGSHVVSPPMLGLAIIMFVFVLFCGLYGPSLGKFNLWGKEEMPAFFAIRPMTTSQFVFVKMMAAGLGALAAWGIILVLVAVWAIVEASSLNRNESLVRTALADATFRDVAIVSASLLGLLATAWRGVVNGMWTSLAGRKWLAMVLGFSMMGIFIIGGISGWWVYKHAELQPQLLGLVPWLVGIVAVAKLGAAACAIMAIHNRRLVPLNTIKIWIGGWILAGVILFAILSCLVAPTPMLAAGIFLVLPLTRVAAAPLALNWNRHR